MPEQHLLNGPQTRFPTGPMSLKACQCRHDAHLRLLESCSATCARQRPKKVTAHLKRASAGRILSRQLRRQRATWAAGPGMPTLITRGYCAGEGLRAGVNSPSGSSASSSCRRASRKQFWACAGACAL